ncbi:uncharacterized protein EAE98_005364 [Botrytis deweyae]|uniref:Uncharacterized protein n=2 Tax=Botrytis TaxID=33196 RepID=A0A4Z1JPT3_9HELO|nr:uncharacterized protein EAE98_005364 [Botrytis deweyae]KAF7929446.1 hypothetical protein EAE98_005364 [Botrytis deweyae]KAF7938351.1 hypothetical protein EAE99_002023 [Botrytis elliptica]TGO75799.1 hypothetical protein BELL_0191g00010 [Botrytis elliptica]
MSSSNNHTKAVSENGDVATSDADLAQALKELQRGEKTAQMLESNLTNLEKKIDDLLASFEAQGSAQPETNPHAATSNQEKTGEDGHKES